MLLKLHCILSKLSNGIPFLGLIFSTPDVHHSSPIRVLPFSAYFGGLRVHS